MSGETQAVVFAIDDTLYALPVTRVREILDRTPAFRLPAAPAWLDGLIDLRGQSVPVIDLRGFAAPGAAASATTDGRILIVETDGAEGAAIGLLVDQVVDVTRHTADDVEAVPAMVPQHGPWRLHGVLRRGDRFVGLLDMDAIGALTTDALTDDRALAA